MDAGELAPPKSNKALVSLLVLLAIAALYIFLIQIIWNHVIVKKFPNANIQDLSFWDTIALSVFFSLMTGGGGFIQI